MTETFYRCNNLTGNVFIHSNQVSNASSCFAGTSLTKDVYIPFYNTANNQVYGWVLNGQTYYTISNTPANGANVYNSLGYLTNYVVKNATANSFELEAI